MKKIIFIITKSEIGGAQSWVRDQFRMLSGRAELRLVTSEAGWLTEEVGDGRSTLLPGISSAFSFVALVKFYFLIRRESPDLVVCNSAYAGFYGRIASFIAGVKCIYVSHGWSSLYVKSIMSPFFVFLEMVLSFLTYKILCVSRSDADKAISDIHISPSRLHVIRNSVFPMQVKSRADLLGGKLNFVFVARLSKPKRLDLLVESLADAENIHVTVVGDGVLRGGVSEPSNFKFLGAVDGFSDYHLYDAFILLSDSEGLPMSALEAGSAGLPLILSNVGGCHECVAYGNGFLVFNTVESIRSAVSELMLNYECFSDIAHRSMGEFSMCRTEEDYLKLYGLV